MKVIASVNADTLLCEVSTKEIARMRGCQSVFAPGWHNDWTKVGCVHDLENAYNTLDQLRNFDAMHLKNVKDRIDKLADYYSDIKEAHEKLMLFDTLSKVKSD